MKRCVEGSVDWAGLEDAEMMTLAQYIDLLQSYNMVKGLFILLQLLLLFRSVFFSSLW